MNNSRRLITALMDLFGWARYGCSLNIHDAAQKGNFSKVKFILARRPGLVNIKANDGETALHKAANSGCEEVVKLLLANGAEVNAKSNKGHTPLHRVAARGHKKIAELLLAKGAKVDAKDKWGRTPLDVAASEDHKDIVELLRKPR